MTTKSKSPYQDKVYTDNPGAEWWVRTVFAKCVRAMCTNGYFGENDAEHNPKNLPKYGTKKKFTLAELDGMKEHKLPKTLKLGDILISRYGPVEVTGFSTLGNMGPHVDLMGTWGFKDGHKHENAYALNTRLLYEGIRLPFEGEKVEKV